jgi:hypothetical protein
MQKYFLGIVTRTSLLSFIAEQRWPQPIRQRMASLRNPDLARLLTALLEMDVRTIESILL